ncbi:MAG: sigma factor regulator FecR [Chloroflexi bacterium RBG_16_56_11]|nr:MAG: sigma factor regulator FecR [Chloroflexi bacterium RBG_16_56_11]
MDYIEAVADMVAQSKKVVVFTGAGFSTESGVPDFRSPGGVWDRFDPSELNLPNFLRREDVREKYWRMHKMMWETIREAKPNAGHYAVAELHAMGKLDCIITQNTDGLHQKAGVPEDKVLEIHGTMQWVDCLDCGKRYPRAHAHDKMVAGEKIPRCDSCHGLLKPATVAFGQAMPERETRESEIRSSGCDLFLAAGSSLVVYPAAQMPVLAKRGGAKLVILNLTETPHDYYADIVIAAKTGEAMSRIVAKAKEKQPS